MPLISSRKHRVAFFLALAFFGLTTCSASAQSKFETRSWMEDLFDSPGRTINVGGQVKPASDVQLGQLAIPGSHDSTAENMGDFADECEQAGFFQRHFGKGLTRRYARTQHHDLYTQARLGVRSFDIRPYYSGGELRTCHTLDAGTFRSAFEGDGGLQRFIRENPKEVVIVNVSHFRPRRGDDDSKHDRGIVAMASYLRDNVCPNAMDPSVVAEPGAVTLGQMWAAKKNYVVVADNDEDLHKKLRDRLGDGKCIYNSAQLSGGYAGERDRVSYGDGKSSSTNLWRGILGEVFCERRPFVSCDYGENGLESPDTVRRATEKVLMDTFQEKHKSLHETSYIWVYGNFAGFNDTDVVRFRVNASDSALTAATDDRRLLVDDGVFKNTYVHAGLKPYAADFINRLRNQSDLRKTGTGVGVVNMDAIGRDNTFEEFISPMLVIDRQILTR